MEEALYAFFTRASSDWRGQAPCLLCSAGRYGSRLRCPFGQHCAWTQRDPATDEEKHDAYALMAKLAPAPVRDETLLPMREFLARHRLPYPRLYLCSASHMGRRGLQKHECAQRSVHSIDELLLPFRQKTLQRYLTANLTRQQGRMPRLPLTVTAPERFCCHLCQGTRLSGVVQLQGPDGELRSPLAILRCARCPKQTRLGRDCCVVTYVCIYEPMDLPDSHHAVPVL